MDGDLEKRGVSGSTPSAHFGTLAFRLHPQHHHGAQPGHQREAARPQVEPGGGVEPSRDRRSSVVTSEFYVDMKGRVTPGLVGLVAPS